MKFVASLLVAGVSPQWASPQWGSQWASPWGTYPASYGMRMPGFNYGNQFNSQGYFGSYNAGPFGGYDENVGVTCRRGIKSDDLDGFQRCYCDQNHRDEDFCNDDELTAACADTFDETEFPDMSTYIHSTYRSDVALKNALDEYYDDVYDEDCVERLSPPRNVRTCPKGTYTKDLNNAACWCDQNHKKSIDDLDDLDDCSLYETVSLDDEFWVAMHYELDHSDVEFLCGEFICARRQLLGEYNENPPSSDCMALNDDAGEDFEKFDPNCIDRESMYGGYGAYGGVNWGMNQGFQSFQGFQGFPGFGFGMSNQFYPAFNRG